MVKLKSMSNTSIGFDSDSDYDSSSSSDLERASLMVKQGDIDMKPIVPGTSERICIAGDEDEDDK